MEMKRASIYFVNFPEIRQWIQTVSLEDKCVLEIELDINYFLDNFFTQKNDWIKFKYQIIKEKYYNLIFYWNETK